LLMIFFASFLVSKRDVLSLASFVPEDQPAKLAAIADAGSILLPTLTPPAHPPSVTAADLRLAVSALSAKLEGLGAKLPAANPLLALGADLDRLKAGDNATLLAANDALVRFLPIQLDRLRTALAAKPVTLADVPPDLARQWMLPDGRARVQVLPRAAVMDKNGIRRFVDQVEPVMPQATGSAVWIVRSAQTIIRAFAIAAVSAILAIALLLAIALRRPIDVALVMTPLLVSSMLTVLVVRSAGISLNFANIIALPLLLGVGVSFNIYFIMNWRAGAPPRLTSATTRAVVFSALTTGTAFGSLAVSAHPGTASMGTLLLISLGCTLLASLVFVPAALRG